MSVTWYLGLLWARPGRYWSQTAIPHPSPHSVSTIVSGIIIVPALLGFKCHLHVPPASDFLYWEIKYNVV